MPVAEEKMVKLNLGCGGKIWPGFVNVDFEDNHSDKKPDVIADIRQLPFPDGHADEIHAIHVLEHFYIWEVGDLLREWKRVLKLGGLLVLEMPDIEKILHLWSTGFSGMAKTWLALYGDQNTKDPRMVHKWCYDFNMLREILESLDFGYIVKKEPVYHMKIRDMRIESRNVMMPLR